LTEVSIATAYGRRSDVWPHTVGNSPEHVERPPGSIAQADEYSGGPNGRYAPTLNKFRKNGIPRSSLGYKQVRMLIPGLITGKFNDGMAW